MERSYISLRVSFCFNYIVICCFRFGEDLGNRFVCRVLMYSLGYCLAVPRNDGAHTTGKGENKHRNAHNEHSKREEHPFCTVFPFHYFICLPCFYSTQRRHCTLKRHKKGAVKSFTALKKVSFFCIQPKIISVIFSSIAFRNSLPFFASFATLSSICFSV